MKNSNKVKKIKKTVDIWYIVLYNTTCAQEKGTRNGVWLSLARAPGLGPGGRRFESCHPDFLIKFSRSCYCAGVVQW